MNIQTANYTIGEAAFAVDKRGIIFSWNSAAEKLFNYPASSALGQRCWRLMDGKDVFGNRFCSENCPLREMALKHESVHSFDVLFKTAYKNRKKFRMNCLFVFGGPEDEMLLHICNCIDESPQPAEHTYAGLQAPEKSQRDSLTTRELEVIALLAEGRTTREISSSMRVAHSTVRNHIQHALHKLHAHTRLEAVVVSKRLRLI